MKVLRFLVAFFFIGGLSAILTLSLSALGSRFWPIALLLLVVGGCLTTVRTAERFTPTLVLGYGCAFTLTLLASLPASVAPRSIMLRSLAYGALSVILGACVLVALIQALQRTEKGVGWLALALIAGIVVAYVSGDKGGAGPMREFFRRFFSNDVAEVILWISRKAIHIGFYGTLAWLFFRGSKLGGNGSPWPAAIFALSHGAFDEYRQHFSAVRIGTPFDLLFDGAGVLLFLKLAGAWQRS